MRSIGEFKLAARPKPLAKEAEPLPATVPTCAVSNTMKRIRCPLSSETYSVVKLASRATPRGWLNLADVPIASRPPGALLPAVVETDVVEIETQRMR